MRVRNEVFLGLLVSAIVVGVTGKAILDYRGAMVRMFPASGNIPTAQPVQPSSTSQQAIRLSAEETAKHASQSDCWIIVEGNVYAVTSYLRLHPGGAQRIGEYCGKDASKAFATRGGKGFHSAVAKQLLSMLKIGPLGGAADHSTVQSIDTSVKTDSAFQQSGEDEEDDD